MNSVQSKCLDFKLSINLATWNGAKYLPFLFASLKKQTFKNWTVLVLDNNSQDDTVDVLKKKLNKLGVQYRLIEKKENIGFATAHNELYESGGVADCHLVLNQDTYLTEDCLQNMVNFLDKNERVGAVSPRLMKWNFPDLNGDKIDSLGLKIFKNRRVVDKYAGRDWHAEQSKLKMSDRTIKITDTQTAFEVFGVPATVAMYKNSILREVNLGGKTIFDKDYHSYKEDIDLSFKLRQAGFKSYILMDTVAYHDRSGAGSKNLSDRGAIINKKSQPEMIRYFSYKNHLATLYKNEYWQNFVLDIPWIFWYEFKKFVYFLLFDRKILKGLKDLFESRKELNKKRMSNIAGRKVDWKEMRRWWS
ncbi:MAG: glycosyltransferase family 2 protein [bacterium]